MKNKTNKKTAPVWQQSKDEKGNTFWYADSPITDIFEFPYQWRLKQKLVDNTIVWYEDHDPEVVPFCLQTNRYCSLVEAKEEIKEEHFLLWDEINQPRTFTEVISIRASTTKDDSETCYYLNVENDYSEDDVDCYITHSELVALYKTIQNILFPDDEEVEDENVEEYEDTYPCDVCETYPSNQTTIDILDILSNKFWANEAYKLDDLLMNDRKCKQ